MAQWEEILYLVGEQFGSIGRKLGPNEINYVGLDKDFEIAGDLFAQFDSWTNTRLSSIILLFRRNSKYGEQILLPLLDL